MSKSFCELWTKRFLFWQTKRPPSMTRVPRILNELWEASPSGSWYRLIIYRLDQTDFRSAKDVLKLSSWMDSTLSHPSFIKLRSTHYYETGVQVWLSSQEDVTVFKLNSHIPVLNYREFGFADFGYTITTALSKEEYPTIYLKEL